MKSNLFIPKKIKVGFQERSDTYTGMLGYVIYYDEKGVLRKETSWNSWRDTTIEPLEFDNEPRENFVLNKDIHRGGGRYSWGGGRNVVRVYDQRGFEFEISVDNLIGILMYSDVSKRDITEKCVFAWSGTELVLLPCNSQEYQESLAFTKLQDESLSTKDLVVGNIYCKKKSPEERCVYLGYQTLYSSYTEEKNNKDNSIITYTTHKNKKSKKHVFHALNGYSYMCPYFSPSMSSLVDTHEKHEDVAQLIEEFSDSIYGQETVGYTIVPYEEIDFSKCYSIKLCKIEGDVVYGTSVSEYQFKDGRYNGILTATKDFSISGSTKILERPAVYNYYLHRSSLNKENKIYFNVSSIEDLIGREDIGQLCSVLKNGKIYKGH